MIRNRDKAITDKTSIGNILVDSGIITDSDLQLAIAYQDENEDYMLGEALVAIGAIERDVVEAMLAAQEMDRKKSRGSGKHVAKIIEIARDRKKRMEEARERFINEVENWKK